MVRTLKERGISHFKDIPMEVVISNRNTFSKCFPKTSGQVNGEIRKMEAALISVLPVVKVGFVQWRVVST